MQSPMRGVHVRRKGSENLRVSWVQGRMNDDGDRQVLRHSEIEERTGLLQHRMCGLEIVYGVKKGM